MPILESPGPEFYAPPAPVQPTAKAADLYSATSSYHLPCLDHRRRQMVLSHLMPQLQAHYKMQVFDIIVCCGAGSVAMGAVMADRVGCELCIVRKRGEPDGHCGSMVLGPDRDAGPQRWIFVDDLISTGSTLHWVMEKIRNRYEDRWQLAGTFLYHDNREDHRPYTPFGQLPTTIPNLSRGSLDALPL